MGIPANVARVSMIGAGPGSELFDTSFWITTVGSPDQTQANTIAFNVASAWINNCQTNWCSWANSAQKYTEVRVYCYNVAGPKATSIGTYAFPVPYAGTGAGKNPLQTSMVVTLRTPLAGRSYRGRMYLPATGVTLGTDFLWTQTQVDALKGPTGNFLEAVNALADPVGQVVVVSQTLTGFTPVTSLTMDNKPDIQRRRANKLVASYTGQEAVA